MTLSKFLVPVCILLVSCTSQPNVAVVEPWNPPESSLGSTSFYAFVGKKISVREFSPTLEKDVILMDLAFEAEYEVLEQLAGPELPDRIRFEAYDHYGFPEFAKHDVVLLYLVRSQEDARYYHVKYTFDHVFSISGNRWITCGNKHGWDDKPLLKTRVIRSRHCKRGNYAIEVVEARMVAGQFDYD